MTRQSTRSGRATTDVRCHRSLQAILIIDKRPHSTRSHMAITRGRTRLCDAITAERTTRRCSSDSLIYTEEKCRFLTISSLVFIDTDHDVDLPADAKSILSFLFVGKQRHRFFMIIMTVSDCPSVSRCRIIPRASSIA